MQTNEGPPRFSRRDFLATGSAAALVVTSGAVISPLEAWGLEVKTLKPETMKTLIKVARDIYPHDRFPDRIYALAVKGYDEKAGADAAVKSLIEDGILALDGAAKGKHGVPYAEVGWEIDRVALLRGMEKSPFFKQVRGDLVVSIYNQQDVWKILGYEGESASEGGYINRGFNDLAWL